MTESLHIGNRVETFVDEYLLAEKNGVEITLNRPERREVVVMHDEPWEGDGTMGVSVVDDDGTFRMYYRATFPENQNDRSEAQACAYAESTDGVHWTKPRFGFVAYGGSPKTNLLLRGSMCINFAPFRDTNPDCPADSRYKAICGLAPEGVFAYGSADGLRWRLLSDEPVMTKGAFDTMNIAFFDVNRKAYAAYTRYIDLTPDVSDLSLSVRAIQSSVSDDFIRWTDPVPNRYSAGAPREHLYTNATILCPGAEHMYFAFPMRFVPERHKVDEHLKVGVSDNVMMTSRDGVTWDRRFLQSWVPAGLNPHCWTQRSLTPLRGIVKTGDEFSMYVTENYMWSDMCVRRVTVPLYRFASVAAARSGGEFTTRPIRLEGRELNINYSTGGPGSVRVGVHDADGNAVPGFSITECDPIFGDELATAVSWNGSSDLAFLAGRDVTLRFELIDARVFALQVR